MRKLIENVLDFIRAEWTKLLNKNVSWGWTFLGISQADWAYLFEWISYVCLGIAFGALLSQHKDEIVEFIKKWKK